MVVYNNENLCIYCGCKFKRKQLLEHVERCEKEYFVNNKKYLNPFSCVKVNKAANNAKRQKIMKTNHCLFATNVITNAATNAATNVATNAATNATDTIDAVTVDPSSSSFLSSSSFIVNINNNHNNNELDPSSSLMIPSIVISNHDKNFICNILGTINQYSMVEKQLLEMHNQMLDMRDLIAKRRPKKIKVLEYLNQYQAVPDFGFKKLPEIIFVEYSDIEYLFAHSVTDTMNHIFEKCLYSNGKTHTEQKLPIVAFERKPPAIFIFEETTNWQTCSYDQIGYFLSNVQQKISIQLSEWKKKNKTLVETNDYKLIQYNRTISKLMAPDFLHNETTKKMYFKMIYTNMQKANIRELYIDFD